MSYRVEVRVVPRKGILDPQGQAVHGALHSLGFTGVTEVHVGRYVTLSLDAGSPEEARRRAESMCRQLLANPVTEDFDLRVLDEAEVGA
jgi:phosphoribosylformylglycinamidine synthase subunit PurS